MGQVPRGTRIYCLQRNKEQYQGVRPHDLLSAQMTKVELVPISGQLSITPPLAVTKRTKEFVQSSEKKKTKAAYDQARTRRLDHLEFGPANKSANSVSLIVGSTVGRANE